MVTREQRRREQAARRLRRLRLTGADQVRTATECLERAGSPPGKDLRIRVGFSYRSVPASIDDYSDRAAPPRHQRPPATRLLSPKGSALRLALLTLAVAQHHRAGTEFENPLPLVGSSKPSATPGWVQLITTPAQHTELKNGLATRQSKRQRSLDQALDALQIARLVEFPNWGEPRGKRERFLLRDDEGESPEVYRVPRRNDDTFTVPAGFLHLGWVHVLEDSEIALLLMVLCSRGSLTETEGWVAIPSGQRLLHYGLSRDNFSVAHRALEELGLLDVQMIDRHQDGRAVDFRGEGALLHRLRVRREGFDEDAYKTATATLERLSHE